MEKENGSVKMYVRLFAIHTVLFPAVFLANLLFAGLEEAGKPLPKLLNPQSENCSQLRLGIQNLSPTPIGDPKSGNTVFRDCGTLPVNNKVVNANTELASSKQNLKSSNPKSAIQNLSSTQTCPRLREGIGEPQLDKAEFARKTKKLQIPFIANNGQVDEQVRFYAKTFGGTVFVTKNGEIVYSLPNNSSDVETQCLASLMHSPNGMHNARCIIQDPRNMSNTTNHVSCIVHRVSCIVHLAL